MKAWAATVAMTAAMTALVLSGAGCSKTEYVSLRAGQCLPADAEVVGTREADPPTVPCGVAHRYEVYAVGALDATGPYPGEDAVDSMALKLCGELFEPNVGFSPLEMDDETKTVFLQPSESSWNNEDDRDVECLLVFDEDREGAVIK